MQIFWNSNLRVLGVCHLGRLVFVLLSEEPPGAANVGVSPWRTGIGLDAWPTQFWCKDASDVSAKEKKLMASLEWPY